MDLREIVRAFKTPLTLLVLLGFVLAVGAWGYRAVATPVPKAPPKPCVVTSIGPTYTPKNAWIRIYNGTDRSGLAKNTKLVFGSAGFHVLKAVNADAPVAATHVAGVAADSPEVQLVMSYFPKGTPFVADPVKYADHMVDIYLGEDFTPSELTAAKPLKSVKTADGATACLAQAKTVDTGGA